MPDSAPLTEDLVVRLAHVLSHRGECLAVAESCTGGALAAALTDLAGSSAWFERGFVTYSNAAKTAMLGVSASTIAKHGAVSEATARAMALGALANSLAHWAVSITGIAGPSGGSTDKPVGTVCFAWASSAEGGACEAATLRFQGDRSAVRAQSVRHALAGLLVRLDHASLLA